MLSLTNVMAKVNHAGHIFNKPSCFKGANAAFNKSDRTITCVILHNLTACFT